MVTRYKYSQNTPYSLHDMRVNRIIHEDDTVVLCFKDGYVSLREPYPQVPGNIRIEKVDNDFLDVTLLSEFGRYGEFTGEKMTLDDFIGRYRDYSFEIVEELYAYNRVEYSGYLTLPGKEEPVEMTLFIYYWGDIVYETEE